MDKTHIDLVVLDIMMPVMDGYEFTRLLRENDNNLPILMISAECCGGQAQGLYRRH